MLVQDDLGERRLELGLWIFSWDFSWEISIKIGKKRVESNHGLAPCHEK